MSENINDIQTGNLTYNGRKFYPYTAVELLVDQPFNSVESQIASAESTTEDLANRFATGVIMVIKES